MKNGKKNFLNIEMIAYVFYLLPMNHQSKHHNSKQLFYIKCKKKNNLKMDLRPFGLNYRVSLLSTFYLTASDITIPSLKSVTQF